MARRVEIKLETDVSYYELPINPIEFENQDSQSVNIEQTVDGYSIEMKSIFDGRPRRMHWENIRNKTPYSTMVANLKSYIGKRCDLRLNYLTGSSSDINTSKIRVVDVQTTWKIGSQNDGGNIKYATIDFIYVPVS